MIQPRNFRLSEDTYTILQIFVKRCMTIFFKEYVSGHRIEFRTLTQDPIHLYKKILHVRYIKCKYF